MGTLDLMKSAHISESESWEKNMEEKAIHTLLEKSCR